MIEHAYIHIPFCLRKCKYCSFVSGENIENKDVYLKSLLNEIKKRYKGDRLKTLYIGGGTPSLLSVSDIKILIDCFEYYDSPEITLEVNPETVKYEKFRELNQIGISRISLGIQTFNDNILKEIGRNHSSESAINAIIEIKKAGFTNINADLIYGLPNQTINYFKDDLIKLSEFKINHISTYGLKIEEGSYFCKNPPKCLPDDEMQANMYNFLCDYLSSYNHYEISNFARDGYISEHNTAYWKNKEYYGFGVNASGYEGKVRYKNTSNFKEYIKNPFNREEEIILTKNEILENEIFLGLRLKEGVNIFELNKKFGCDFIKLYGKIVQKYVNLKLLTYENAKIKLTRAGILLSNEIMSEFVSI